MRRGGSGGWKGGRCWGRAQPRPPGPQPSHLEEGGVLGQARALEELHRLVAAEHAVAVEVRRHKPHVVHLQLSPALRHGSGRAGLLLRSYEARACCC